MDNYFPFHKVILDNEVQSSNDTTKIVKLPLTGYLHTLFAKVSITNGATSCKNQSMDDVVDLIEVVANGSEVLVSLTPAELRRWNLWQTGMDNPGYRSEIAAAVQNVTYQIPFGRWAFDPNYFLPCARLSDLEVRIKYSPTIAATSFATGTTTITVGGLWSMGAAPGEYRGALTHKTLKAFTSAASGDEQTLIPRGNLLRQVMAYAYEAAIEDGTDVTALKFDVNNDERVLYNWKWNDLQDVNRLAGYIKPTADIIAFTADADTLKTGLSRIKSVNIQNGAGSDATADEMYFRVVESIAGDTLTIGGTKADGTANCDVTDDATGRLTYIHVEGDGLPHAVVLDFSVAGESALLNTSEYDQVRLTLTQGGAGADVRISAEEVRVF